VIEILFRGQGGHGSVVASKLLAQAAAKNGLHAQSFASYGALRRGGQVEGYVRISEKPIALHCKMYRSDYVVIMDESLIDEKTMPHFLKENGKILINTPSPKAFASIADLDVLTVDAYRIAAEKGLILPGGMAVINTALLGALIGVIKLIPVECLLEVIKENIPKPNENAECALEGYRQITSSHRGDKEQRSASTEDSLIISTTRRFPIHNPEKMKRCHRCLICYIVCPSLAITFEGDPLQFNINKKICTGCGICIEECPKNAISWER